MFRVFILAVLLALSVPARSSNYTDWWADTAVAGSSINIAQQGNTIFFAWYLYGQDNNPKWIYGAGQISNDIASVDLFEARGPFLGSTSQVVSTKVGTATFNFLSTGSLRFTYSTSSVGSGVLNLSRFNIVPLPVSGAYYAMFLLDRYDCPDVTQNGLYWSLSQLSISVSGSSLSATNYGGGEVCSYTGSYSQKGSRFEGSGTYSCASAASGTWAVKDAFVDDGRLVADFDMQVNGGCRIRVNASGVSQTKFGG